MHGCKIIHIESLHSLSTNDTWLQTQTGKHGYMVFKWDLWFTIIMYIPIEWGGIYFTYVVTWCCKPILDMHKSNHLQICTLFLSPTRSLADHWLDPYRTLIFHEIMLDIEVLCFALLCLVRTMYLSIIIIWYSWGNCGSGAHRGLWELLPTTLDPLPLVWGTIAYALNTLHWSSFISSIIGYTHFAYKAWYDINFHCLNTICGPFQLHIKINSYPKHNVHILKCGYKWHGFATKTNKNNNIMAVMV